ncbi:MAG: hypothetical protein KAT68_08675 [Bacteroidales bacterium]|nr:hypothetical protein [Bacteroidales bacterium]
MKFRTFFLFITIIYLFSCNREEFITDNTAKLEFSVDTVMFDTVFTTIGSTTKSFKVYNRHKKYISISSIILAKGDNSNFRININGISGNAKNIEIPPQDSMFVFVEVNVDPNRDEMIEQDSIVFITNGNAQDIDLVAFGQDVNLVEGEIIESQTWTNEKPYLIYYYIAVDTLQTLTIEQGTHIYFHKEAYMYVQGTLIVNGTIDEPVIFEGDRLEYLYEDVPGQWGGIHFVIGTENNLINYAEIKNATTGVRADSIVNFTNPTVTISNTRIENMSYAGILGLGTSILCWNSVIANCGFYAIAIPIGGSYEFYHCTVSNNYEYGNRTESSIWLNNYYTVGADVYIRPLDNAYFGNCIIYGNNRNEVGYSTKYASVGALNYKFDHCLLKIADTTDISDTDHFESIIKNLDPKFISIDDNNFQLDTLSPAKDFGKIEFANFYPLDFNQENRLTIDNKPDLGAYERVEE